MNWIYHLKIKQKILVLLIIMFLSIIVVGAIGIIQLNTTSKRMDDMYQNNLLSVKKINMLRVYMRSIQTNILQTFVETSLSNEDIMREVIRDEAALKALVEELMGYLPDEKFSMLTTNIENFNHRVGNMITMITANQMDEAAQYYNDYSLLIDNFSYNLKDLADYVSDDAEQTIIKNQKEVNRAYMILLTTILTGIIIGMILGWIMNKLITGPIHKLAGIADQVTKGDLRVEPLLIRNKDEIGRLAHAFNQMIQSLQHIIRQAGQTSREIAGSSETMTAVSGQTSDASKSSAMAVESINESIQNQLINIIDLSKSINEITQGIQQIAADSEIVVESAVSSRDNAKKGQDVIARSMKTIESMTDDVVDSSHRMIHLGEKMKAINDIMVLISSIASQTNLLSLNATIEAARAGEQGRGFAVVANEVRKLSVESNEAAKQVSAIVLEINTETKMLVESMSRSAELAENSLASTLEAGTSFDQIAVEVEQVSTQIISVSSVVQQVSAYSEEILNSVQLLSKMVEDSASQTEHVAATTEQTLASMEEVKYSATALNELAEQLDKLISNFKS